jgi:hypothetical protein
MSQNGMGYLYDTLGDKTMRDGCFGFSLKWFKIEIALFFKKYKNTI